MGDGCGIYVDASVAPGGEGTKASPVATLDEAIAAADAAGENRIYICGGTYAGGQIVPGGTSLLGGFECDWTRAEATRPSIEAEVGGSGGPVATLTVDGAGSTRLEDLDIVATLAPATPGASAIGVLAVDTDLAVARVDIDVADAANGATGDTPVGGDLDGVTSVTGNGAACGAPPTVEGGDGGFKTCGDGTTSVGGDGGKGTVNGGAPSDGDEGVSDPQVSAPIANAGAGEPVAGNCTGNFDGAPGAPGSPAVATTGLGAISSNGFVGVPGNAGQGTGLPGQGGGGGGGGRGADHCAPVTNAGPSGGGGGSGGCGGAEGAGGGAGGSSIGIAAIRTALSVETTTISAGNGGIGGAGSPGQQGGQGGGGALQGGAGACSGGQGGRGGWGGAGGGGFGGHSIAIAYFDAPSEPDLADDLDLQVGGLGNPGPGGDGPEDALNGNSASNVGPAGDAGVRCAVLHFGVDPGDACVVEAG